MEKGLFMATMENLLEPLFIHSLAFVQVFCAFFFQMSSLAEAL